MTLPPAVIWIIWASVAAFAIHNVEEIWRIEAWALERMDARTARRYRTSPFFLAAGLLWVAYAAVAIWAQKSPSDLSLLPFCLGFSAIFANAILHIVANLILRQNMPGIWSAALLIVPLSLASIWLGVVQGLLTPWQIFLFFFGGAILQLPLAFLAIYFANCLLGSHQKENKNV